MEIEDINLKDYEIADQPDNGTIVLRKKLKYPEWENLAEIKGWVISNSSTIEKTGKCSVEVYNKNVFLTEKQAKSALAMAQISQLMPFYGGEITDEEWMDSGFTKSVIFRQGNEIGFQGNYKLYGFLAFHTREQREAFLKNNEQLVKDYLMIE